MLNVVHKFKVQTITYMIITIKKIKSERESHKHILIVVRQPILQPLLKAKNTSSSSSIFIMFPLTGRKETLT